MKPCIHGTKAFLPFFCVLEPIFILSLSGGRKGEAARRISGRKIELFLDPVDR
jgi:hypothetical protein